MRLGSPTVDAPSGRTRSAPHRRPTIKDDAAERRRITDYVGAGHVDGVLVVSSHAGSPVLAALLDKGIPTIACGAPLGYEGRVGYVEADETGGARTMVRHLLARGRQRIATIT